MKDSSILILIVNVQTDGQYYCIFRSFNKGNPQNDRLQVQLFEQGTAFTGSTTLHPNQTATFINVLLSRPPKSPPGEGFNSKLPAMPSNNLHKLSSSISGTQASLLIY